MDEANTSGDVVNIGAELMTDGTAMGRKVPAVLRGKEFLGDSDITAEDSLQQKGGEGKGGLGLGKLKLVMACNPYKFQPTAAIASAERGGLGVYRGNNGNQVLTTNNDVNNNLNEDSEMRKLVYRVVKLPPSLRYALFNFLFSADSERIFLQNKVDATLDAIGGRLQNLYDGTSSTGGTSVPRRSNVYDSNINMKHDAWSRAIRKLFFSGESVDPRHGSRENDNTLFRRYLHILLVKVHSFVRQDRDVTGLFFALDLFTFFSLEMVF